MIFRARRIVRGAGRLLGGVKGLKVRREELELDVKEVRVRFGQCEVKVSD
jgi:hypothetical protein